MVPGDAPTVATYCNDPEIAKYQDWELPVNEEELLSRLRAVDRPAHPTPQQWVTYAVDFNGVLAGEVGIGLDHTGCVATLGYTLALAFHGQGIASTAVDLVLEYLFTQTTVHRIEATIDPENWASARVLERLGFRYEGRRYRSALVRGEWLDDDAYELIVDDWRRWRARPQSQPRQLRLEPITPESRDAVERLCTHHSQERFVAPMARSFAQALIPDVIAGHPIKPWMRAVVADDEIVAFMMVVEPEATHPEPYLWRLLIDRFHQRRGIGSAALGLLIQELRSQGHHSLTLSYGIGPGSPEGFYRRYGFVPTGELDEDEVVAKLTW